MTKWTVVVKEEATGETVFKKNYKGSQEALKDFNDRFKMAEEGYSVEIKGINKESN